MGLFVDILIEEVKEHEILLIEENKKPLKSISKLRFKGLSSKTLLDTKKKFYDTIFLEILELERKEEIYIEEIEKQEIEKIIFI